MFNNAGTMEVAGGNYIFNGLGGGAMFFSENSNMIVTGGTFTQNSTGWMFNTRGDGSGNVITVSGGTYNRNFVGGAAFEENDDGEVVLAEGLGLHKIGENLWSVLERTPGDVDEDGNLTAKDVVLLRRYIAGLTDTAVSTVLADVNGDGSINAKDVVKLRQIIAANN